MKNKSIINKINKTDVKNPRIIEHSGDTSPELGDKNCMAS
jgi:hypothetical protein